MTRRARGRGGFTVVELLVVIAIIAILASLTAGGVGRVRAAALRAQTSTDIAQIANAIGAFKVKFNVDYLPSTFKLEANYTDAGSDTASANYLKSMFPNINLASTGLTDKTLDANECLVFFLTGGTSVSPNYTGFSINRAAPFTTGGGDRIGPFLDIPQSRLVDPATGTADGRYRDTWGTPFAYFSSQNPGSTSATTYSTSFNFGSAGTVNPFVRNGRNEQAKSFQIVSAGADMKFGPGGDYKGTNANSYKVNGGGWDDIANFVGGTLGNAP